ncbi:MAG: prohibitin family protein [Candidatus Marinamargulisbacteria bacterium]
MSQQINMQQIPFKSIISFAVIGFLVIAIQSAFVIVESGHVGVIKRLGAVQPQQLNEGFHFKLPVIDDVVQLDIRLRKVSNDSISASKDLQTVRTEVSVQYSLNGNIAPKSFQKIGIRQVIESTLIEPAIQESVKSVTALYTAEELITQREQVKLKIQEEVEQFIEITLERKGVTAALSIANVAITDFAFSNEFNRAIELKVKAEQEALQAKNEKTRRVTQAEAAAAEKKLAAEAEAFQISIESKARAAAIKREANALKGNPALIQLRMAEKWNGELPRFTSNGSIPMFDASSMLANQSKK